MTTLADVIESLAKWMYESETTDEWQDLPEEAQRVWRHNARATIEFLAVAGHGPVQQDRTPVIGHVVVNRETRKLDWDGELHRLRVDALSSLTGPYQHHSKSLETESEDLPYWGRIYEICPVHAPEAARTSSEEHQALADPEGIALVQAIHDRKNGPSEKAGPSSAMAERGRRGGESSDRVVSAGDGGRGRPDPE